MLSEKDMEDQIARRPKKFVGEVGLTGTASVTLVSAGIPPLTLPFARRSIKA